MSVIFRYIQVSEYWKEDMATYSFTNHTFNIKLTSRESKALGRPNLSLDKARVLAVNLLEFPHKSALGARVSKGVLFPGVMGEYRSNSKKVVVLGSLRGSGASLKITLSHPSIDEIWVCGSAALELEKKLAVFIKSK
jgi:hypothetical protein